MECNGLDQANLWHCGKDESQSRRGESQMFWPQGIYASGLLFVAKQIFFSNFGCRMKTLVTAFYSVHESRGRNLTRRTSEYNRRGADHISLDWI